MVFKANVRMAGLAALLFSSAAVQAGGLWINEYGQPTMGRAGAGEEAGTDDASTAMLNPAAMSRIEKTQIMVTGGAIYSDIEFDLEQGSALNGNGDGGSAGSLAPLGSIYYVRPIDDRWTVGMSALALTGSALDYDDDWAGRFQAQDVSIIVAGLVPAVAYRFTDKFSIGFAVPVMYSSLELDIAVPNIVSAEDSEGKAEIDGDDVEVALQAAFLYEFTENTRIGGRVTSKFDFEYDGDLSRVQVDQQVGLETELTMASIARVGLMHDFGEKWSAHATLGWDNWSELGDVNLSTSTNGLTLPRRWEDTYHYALGADYRLSDTWTLRAGAAYDTNPVSSRDRTSDMPLDRQVRLAFGADYMRDSGMKVSGSLVYADYGDAAINSSRQPPLVGYKGEYSENQIWFAAVSFNWPLGD